MSYVGKLKIGTQVLVSNNDKFTDKKAVVMFVGKLAGKTEEFIGIQLQTPDGSHSGTFEGKEYFKAKENHGMFAKPRAVKLLDGTPLTSLLTAPTTTGAKTATTTAKNPTTQPGKTTTTTTKPPTVGTKTTKPAQTKPSNDLKEFELTQEIEGLKQQLEEAKQKITVLESTDTQQELIAMRQRIRELEDENRMLKVQQEKAKLQSSSSSEQKTKELQEKIDFFNSQKEHHEKEKADLKKKIANLEEELESYEGNLQEFEKLTFKVENLQAKNAKLRQELQAAKTENRNNQMLKPSGQKDTSENASKFQELEENIKILNETISLIEGDLNQEKEKSANLQKQLETIKSKGGDVTKLQKKLKAKDQQLQALKSQLQASGDAASFAQKLTMDLLRKDQELKQSTTKLTEYLNQIQGLELQISQAKQMIDLQTQQLQTQEEQIQKVMNEKQQQQNHIAELNKQIGKYKSKIAQLAQNNQSLINQSQLMDQTMGEDEMMLKTYINTDIYQHKYFEALKSVQQLSEKYLENYLQSSTIKNTVGVQMLNLIETIPESYTQQFYPEIIKIVIDIKTANDKLYLLFDTAASYFRTKNDIYAKDNLELAHWLVLILEQVPILYGNLTKIQLSITTADTEEEISDIVSNIVLKDIIKRTDSYASEILQRFAADNIDPSIDLGPFIEPIESLDKICAQGRKLEYEHQTRNKLCVSTMAAIFKIYDLILNFKQESEVGDSAQVDTMIENFLKSLMVYLKECCTNPQLRIRTQTKSYLSGLELIITLLEQISLNEDVAELSSLYSEKEDIRDLKETLLTTQYHLKELINDLNDIIYPNQLSKIKCHLPGKVWVDKANLINKELSRFQELMSEKEELQANLLEAKKKILILEKEIKDRQATRELHEKRIGELQLKVEQASALESENKKYQQKIRSYEDTNKLIEDEVQAQINKRKSLEEQIARLKEQIKLLESEGGAASRPKEKKMSTALAANSNEEVTSLAIFKNVLQECHTLKTLELKKRILHLKQSPLLAKLNPQQSQATENSKTSQPQAIRRKALDAMCNLKITDPRKKPSLSENSALVTLQALQHEADEYVFKRKNIDSKKEELVEMKIGEFTLRGRENKNMSSKIDVGSFKILSF